MASLVSQPIDGTDAKQEHVQTKKAYLDLLVNIMTGRLYVVFVSPSMSNLSSLGNVFLTSTNTGNKSLVEALCQFGLTAAGDPSDPPSQRVAWTLLARLTTHFGRSQAQADLVAKERAQSGKPADDADHSIPGYELFVYDRLIPLAFELPNRQGFNLKDAQTLQVNVLSHVALFLSLTRQNQGAWGGWHIVGSNSKSQRSGSDGVFHKRFSSIAKLAIRRNFELCCSAY